MRISDWSSDVCSSDLWWLLRCRYKYVIAIPEYTVIGPGLFINRFGGIYVNGDAVIGAYANLTHGAMLGQVNRGERAGSPILGDRLRWDERRVGKECVSTCRTGVCRYH